MNDTLYIRLAVAADLPRLMEIFSAARAFMRSQGNFAQWTGGYPSPELVSDDISRGQQYAVCRRPAFPTFPAPVASAVPSAAAAPAYATTPVQYEAAAPAADSCPHTVPEDEIVATFWFSTAPEPSYEHIFDGVWLSENDASPLFPPPSPASVSYEGEPRARKSPAYGTVHRLASDGSASGVGAMVLRWALARCGDVRVDTHRANSLMQSLLRREGFTRCGTIFLADGSPRDAFERILSPAEAKKMVRRQVRERGCEQVREQVLGRTQTSTRPETHTVSPRVLYEPQPEPPRVLYGAFASTPTDITAPPAVLSDTRAYAPAAPSTSKANSTSPLSEARAYAPATPRTAAPFDPASPSPVLSEARTVALFCALEDEPPVDFLLAKWLTVKRLALPVVTSQPGEPPRMEFREYTGTECLKKGSFGIPEPADTPLVPAAEIDVMLVPGVAYTADGQRLGRGGGFYDRYLSEPAAAGIYRIGICAPTSLVEWLPMEAHDVVMNEIWILP